MTFNVAEWSEKPITEFTYRGLYHLLPILDKLDIKATFFITGFFAEREVSIVKKIQKRGHEIACHSLANRNLSKYTAAKLHEEVAQSKKILETVTGKKIHGFRIPLFYDNKHLHEVITNLDFKYDSSSHPAFVPGKYYHPHRKKKPHYVGELIEMPVSVFPFTHTPISSGFMRNFSNIFTLTAAQINSLSNKDIILYFYPWEFINLSRMKGKNPFITRKTGTAFRKKFANLLAQLKKKGYSFDLMKDIQINGSL